MNEPSARLVLWITVALGLHLFYHWENCRLVFELTGITGLFLLLRTPERVELSAIVLRPWLDEQEAMVAPTLSSKP